MQALRDLARTLLVRSIDRPPVTYAAELISRGMREDAQR